MRKPQLEGPFLVFAFPCQSMDGHKPCSGLKLPARQAGGVLAAQEMLTQCEHTLHLAKASAASVLQLLEHQK